MWQSYGGNGSKNSGLVIRFDGSPRQSVICLDTGKQESIECPSGNDRCGPDKVSTTLKPDGVDSKAKRVQRRYVKGITSARIPPMAALGRKMLFMDGHWFIEYRCKSL